MRLPAMDTLRKVAFYTAVAGISGCVYLQIKATSSIGQSPYFRAAFKTLRADPSAIKLLGEPIKQLGFNYADKDNFCDGRSAQYHVRIKGPNDKGMMYFWAQLNDEQVWTIEQIELELNKHPGKRLSVSTKANIEPESTATGRYEPEPPAKEGVPVSS